MSVHAFIDESARAGTYLLCVTLVEPAHLATTRRALARLLLPGARELHFCKEKPPRRRQLADRIAALPVSSRVYFGRCDRKEEERTRQQCLKQIVNDLLELRAHRVVLDSRDSRDVHDRSTLQRSLGSHPSKTELTYEHLDSAVEPLLWISDAVGWCYGAGGDWRRRTIPVLQDVIEL
ncbi:hypothetical protein L1857_07240 [Amycolatopsis thermalba]|uniref:DUF3800 domain-containing protein n=1 Tax=Amycolatopsis thermalba TaxID=944492 RepID=A0ABY4NRE6_9PSEU|nr:MULTISPECIES: hypothetical protein [Amycolatopsis]UQS22628.1 hypothetical protein L1857_07240 [Amycolatopsis thermalba]